MRGAEEGEKNLIYNDIRVYYRTIMEGVGWGINKGSTTAENAIDDRYGIRTRDTDNADCTALCCCYCANGGLVYHKREFKFRKLHTKVKS